MVPLVFGGRDVGLLELYRRHPLPWNSGEIERAQLLAHQLAAVIDLLARTAGLTAVARSASLRGSRWRSWSTSCGSTRASRSRSRRGATWPPTGTSRSCTRSRRGSGCGGRGSSATTTTCRRTAGPRRSPPAPSRSPTGELLLRMSGPRGDRARRRALAPAGGVTWLRGGGGPAVLRYPAGALVVLGGPPGAGKSTLAARVVDGARVPVLDPDAVRADGGGTGRRRSRRGAPSVGAALAAGSGRGGGDDGAAPRPPARDGEGGRGGRRARAPGPARRRRGRLPRRPRRAGRGRGSPTACSSTCCTSGRRTAARSRARRRPRPVRLGHGPRPPGGGPPPPRGDLTARARVEELQQFCCKSRMFAAVLGIMRHAVPAAGEPPRNHPVDVGTRSEAAILLRFIELGYDVLVPHGVNHRYDFVIDQGDRFLRIQCKTGRLRNGAIDVQPASVRSNRKQSAVAARTTARLTTSRSTAENGACTWCRATSPSRGHDHAAPGSACEQPEEGRPLGSRLRAAEAGEGTRTPGPRLTRTPLYQLSYSGGRARV